MSTVEIVRSGLLGRAFGGREREAREAEDSSRAGVALLAVLVLLVLYAAFDHGADSLAAGARLQVAIAAIATAAAATYLWWGTLRFSAPRLAVIGVLSLGAFAVWSGVTFLWSIAPDQTWTELNRALTYEVVLVLALLAGASHQRAIPLLAIGTLLVVLAVTLYALGQKVLPGLHVWVLFDLNQTQFVPRLQEPFGYWNALGLFIVFGVPIALALTLDPARATRIRLSALLSLELMMVVIGLTYSRGALLALGCGLFVAIAISRCRLRSLMWLALACVATVPPLIFGLASHDLTTVAVPLSTREQAGAELGGLLLVSLAALWFEGAWLIALERRIDIGPERARGIGHMLVGALGVALVCAVIAVALSSRGLGGTVSHAWKSFTTTQTTSNYNPQRLLSAASANRWVWWKEAAGAFSDRPLTGWGAGSFPVLHLLYRRDTLTVQQPHSVPLQFLAETGIIGAVLAIGGYVLLAAGGVGSVRQRVGGERLLAAALLAGVVAYGVHVWYDWDWDIPGVTFPVLLFAGVLAGARNPTSSSSSTLSKGLGPGLRAAALAAITATLCAFALSGVIPSVAASRASSAIVAASSSSRPVLERALHTARSATGLDPLSDAGLLASATIALHLGDPEQARSYTLAAIKRDPSDVRAWDQLVVVEGDLRDYSNYILAVKRAAALDPMNRKTVSLLRLAELASAPPAGSATARATPLPSAGGG